ncbi:DNA ligase [Vibrio hippocampi]|uniref:DNA ligase n=1 Tax=Vibrio hippocampi TaxID=654686 RepID=A0ABM8ZMV9_9VIBR|nr:DNA ligase [Vibrio hippocampi]CAH0529556.1 DNA ligase [Vibrio hippocampi]
MYFRLSALSIAFLCSFSLPTAAESRFELPVMNAQHYQSGINVLDYWKSEKLDGIRAIWTGSELVTRKGRKIVAPDWFSAALPKTSLEGELWAGRGNFHLVQQTVLDKTPNDKQWKNIDFMVFDLPEATGDYQKRYDDILRWVKQTNQTHIKYVEHTPITSEAELFAELDRISDQDGEGLMLRKVSALYQASRSSNLLKLKKYHDMEGVVVGYKSGNGKYQGMMGSLLVRVDPGIEFYIGSGFSDQERQHPPKMGAVVTFRYNGLTQNGVPKFARYLRERKVD